MDAHTRLLRLPEVIRRTGLPRSSIYEKVAAGTMPAPVRMSARVVAWIEEEIEQFLRELIAASRNGGSRRR